jgi:hypothetical protein
VLANEEAKPASKPIALVKSASDRTTAPLSYSQQRLWFLEQLQPGTALYHIPVAVRLRGELNVEALQSAIEKIIERHEILRSGFVIQEGRPIQRIEPQVSFVIARIDVSAAPDPAKEAQVQAEQLARAPFQLDRPPLLRATLFHLAHHDSLLALTFHHITFDGASLALFVDEVETLYLASQNHEEPALPPLEFQFADYAIHEQSSKREADAVELAFWEKQLSGQTRPVDIPHRKPRPAVQAHRGAHCPLGFPADLSRKISLLCRQNGTTLFMTLAAGLSALAYRLTGLTDGSIGTAVANRSRESENLMGVFVNLVALRTDLSGNPTFTDVLKRQRNTALDAFAHSSVPFEAVVDRTGRARDLSRSSLFQTLLVVRHQPSQLATLPGLELTAEPLDTGMSRTDLAFYLAETPGGITGTLEYDTDLFDRSEVEDLVARYARLLELAVENPNRRIADLPIFSREEQLFWVGLRMDNASSDGIFYRVLSEDLLPVPPYAAGELFIGGRETTDLPLEQLIPDPLGFGGILVRTGLTAKSLGDGQIELIESQIQHVEPEPAASPRGHQSDTEVQIAAIWSQVLKKTDLPLDVKFFDAGGDSLRLIETHLRLSQIYPDAITVADLFEHNTIASLATFIDRDKTPDPVPGVQGYEL